MLNRIKIKEKAMGKLFLSGLTGRAIYPQLVAAIDRHDVPSTIFLDFAEVTVSGSFYSQAVLPLRIFARRMNAYLVLSNLNEDSLEELRWLLENGIDAVYVCQLDDNDNITEARWLGNLDSKQRFTFQAVLSEGESDATRLSEKFDSEEIGLTGWNNRLAALNKKGLLMEIKDGRSKRYRPVLQIKT